MPDTVPKTCKRCHAPHPTVVEIPIARALSSWIVECKRCGDRTPGFKDRATSEAFWNRRP